MLRVLAAMMLVIIAFAPSQAQELPKTQLNREEQAIILKIHNAERTVSGKQALQWDDELSSYAQAHANKLAASGVSKHEEYEVLRKLKHGENIHRTSRDDKAYEVNRCGSKWAAEKIDQKTGANIYVPGMTLAQYAEKYPGKEVRHWTQMIWGTTEKLGVGIAQIQTGEKKGGWVVVARYYPAGNRTDQAP